MKDWHKGWMNMWFTCPSCNAISKGYLAPDLPLGERCLCGTEMEGFRIIERETTNAD